VEQYETPPPNHDEYNGHREWQMTSKADMYGDMQWRIVWGGGKYGIF